MVQHTHFTCTVLLVVALDSKAAASFSKAFPLQAWTGPEGSSRLRHSDFKTIGT